MSDDVFLSVESNLTGVGRDILLAARARGYRPVLLTAKPSLFPFIDQHGIDAIAVDTRDFAAVEREASALSKSVRGVFSPLDLFGEQAARIAKSLGLPGHQPQAVADLMDKHGVREALRRYGLDDVPSALATTASAALLSAKRIGFPVILKPRRAAGAFAAKLCANAQEAFDHAERILLTPQSLSVDTTGVVIEKAIIGRQFDVIVFNGRVVTVVDALTEPSLCRIRGMNCPADLDYATARNVREEVERWTTALGVGWGPLDVEVRVAHPDGAVHLIEFNPRLPSGPLVQTIERALGINLLNATIDACCGNSPELVPREGRHASLRFLFRASNLTFRQLRIPCHEIPELVQFHLTGSSGEPTYDYRDRVGYAIAVASSYEDAVSAAEQAITWSVERF